jgi:hypothetical protein
VIDQENKVIIKKFPGVRHRSMPLGPTRFLDSSKDKNKHRRIRAPGEDRTRGLSLTKRTHYHYATEAS